MKGFGEFFVAPKGELYHSIRLFDSATALAHANRRGDNQPQICVWTNQYGQGRVFATTIGHYNETMVEPTYLDMVTRGLLWACDKKPDEYFTSTTKNVNDAIRGLVAVDVAPGDGGGSLTQLPTKCCGEDNLVTTGKPTASSEEKNKNK